jgi:hypothetical protein
LKELQVELGEFVKLKYDENNYLLCSNIINIRLGLEDALGIFAG